MNENYMRLEPVLQQAVSEAMTFKRHQELTALAYRVKKTIDAEGGIKPGEACKFGQIMQEIINLK